MKKYILLVVITLLVPLWVAAHGESVEFNETQASQDMMRYIEDQALGDELHEEMEGLMTKMMTGELSQEGADRLAELMEQYPGPHGMMMGRMMGMGFGDAEMMGDGSTPFSTNQSLNSMMGFGLMPFGAFGGIFMILWWVLIIAGIVFFIKWIAQRPSGGDREEKNALEILKERYTKDEIDRKTFEQKVEDLKKYN